MVSFRADGSRPGPWWLRWPAFLFFQFAIAAVAYRRIEAPGISLGKRLASSMKFTPALLLQSK